jgi:hypothetical protein
MNLRNYRIEGDVVYVQLTKGHETVIDCCNVHHLGDRKWKSEIEPHTVYAVRNYVDENGSNKSFRLHRVILNAPEDMDVDHIDGDGLNNRLSNLRLATKQENSCNRRPRENTSSGLKGVTFHKKARKWQAQIKSDGKSRYLGLYLTIELAHAAYCEASNRLHGVFGRAE